MNGTNVGVPESAIDLKIFYYVVHHKHIIQFSVYNFERKDQQ